MKLYFKHICIIFFSFAACSQPQEKKEGVFVPGNIPRDTFKVVVDEKYHQLDTFFINAHKRGFNGNVLIAHYGKIIYQGAFGYARYEDKEPLTLSSAFQLASTSKTFTASAIMLLKEQGKLDYSDHLTKYFPAFPYKDVTIKMLLTHRSGLPNYLYFCYNYMKNFDAPIPNEEVVDLMIKHKPELYFKPDRHFNYSNTNYCVLAAIIEKISGKSYAEYMKEAIFNPLQMNSTWVDAPIDTLNPHKTCGYVGGRWNKDELNCFDGVVGDKGIYSTVEDMFKWDRALYSGQLLKKETLEEAYAPASHEYGGKRNYGYGWRMIDEKDNKIIYHNGWWHSYTTVFYRRLKDQTTIIILSNKYNKSVYNTQKVLEIIDGGAAKKTNLDDGE